MRKYLTAFAVSLIAWTMPGEAAEPIISIPKIVTVTYSDRSVERYELSYQADIRTSQRNTGSAARPLKGKFIDDRRCTWTITVTVTRQLRLINRQEERFNKGLPIPVTSTSLGGRGQGFSLPTLRSRTCGEIRGEIASQEAAARSRITGALPEIVAEDLRTAALPDLQNTFPNTAIRVQQ